MIEIDAKVLPPDQRLVVYRAEQEARLSALEGGARFNEHHQPLRWLALEIWRLEQEISSDQRIGT